MQLSRKHGINKWVLIGLVFAVCSGFFAAGTAVYHLAQPVGLVVAANPVLITIKPGMTTQDIGQMLYEKRLIKNVLLFRIVAKIEGLEKSLQAAEYAVTPNMSVQQIVSMLARGEVAYRQFTIPEGYTLDQVAKLLEEKSIADAAKFKALAKNYTPYEYIPAKPESVYRVEGFLFPDTYRVMRGLTEEQLLRMMIYQFNEQFTPALRERARELGLSIYDVITLASLVEKEARVAEERPLVAGVFYNRLKQGMPLQSCATIQYILGYPKPELTVKDTELPSPYNTYLHMGLPPGPIANPGMAAIKAVLYPADTAYLYFVADNNGYHHFSKTYGEHLAAIAQLSK